MTAGHFLALLSSASIVAVSIITYIYRKFLSKKITGIKLRLQSYTSVLRNLLLKLFQGRLTNLVDCILSKK